MFDANASRRKSTKENDIASRGHSRTPEPPLLLHLLVISQSRTGVTLIDSSAAAALGLPLAGVGGSGASP